MSESRLEQVNESVRMLDSRTESVSRLEQEDRVSKQVRAGGLSQ